MAVNNSGILSTKSAEITMHTTAPTAVDVNGGANTISITSSTYNADAKTVTFVITYAEDTDTVADKDGNTVATTTDVATIVGTTWTLN